MDINNHFYECYKTQEEMHEMQRVLNPIIQTAFDELLYTNSYAKYFSCDIENKILAEYEKTKSKNRYMMFYNLIIK
jgi:hypothetical protein